MTYEPLTPTHKGRALTPGNLNGSGRPDDLTPAQAREMIAYALEHYRELYQPDEQALMDLIEAKVLEEKGDLFGARLRHQSANTNAMLTLADAARELTQAMREARDARLRRVA